eukprot:Nitzschia sp. Nitz4//scaffold30_size153850//60720//61724//NITZ4_002772-RA/size153850-augustus-gene-0.57-mRNA-1//1//CDS//3329547244//2869//frame0
MRISMANNDRYQLSLHGIDLPNKRWFGRSSPYATVKILTGRQRGKELGQTEHLEADLNPDWCKIFFLEFSPAEITDIEVVIWDYNVGHEPLWIGEAKFEATSVFQEPGHTQSRQIGRSDSSRLYCHIEKSRLGPADGKLHLHLRGLDMKNVEPGIFGLGRSDPFFELSKKNADYSIGQVKWNVVYRSEHIDNNLNPYWQPVSLGLEEVCYGSLDWPLKISVYDHNENGIHRLIGEFETSVEDLPNHLAVKGNADREQAIGISKEGKFKTYGLVCVLKATVEDSAEA